MFHGFHIVNPKSHYEKGHVTKNNDQPGGANIPPTIFPGKHICHIEKDFSYYRKNGTSNGNKQPVINTKYFQIFGNNFVNNLSVIDLIFCEGPQARQIIKKSKA